MTAKLSAALLPYRLRERTLEVMLVHPGGPFWARRDAGAWSIAKGEYDASERALDAARREFEEETGLPAPAREPIDLGELTQPSRKVIHAWAVEADLDVAHITSNTFELEWPPRSRSTQRFPEVDRAGWFDLPSAREKLTPGQVPFLDALERALAPRV